MQHVDPELIAAVAEFLACLDDVERLALDERPPWIPASDEAHRACAALLRARSWVDNVLADRPTPVGTTPSPEYAPHF